MLILNSQVLVAKLNLMGISVSKYCQERALIPRGTLINWLENPSQPRLRDIQNLADAADLPVDVMYADVFSEQDIDTLPRRTLLRLHAEEDVMLILNISAIKNKLIDQKKSIKELCNDKRLHISRATYDKWKRDPSYPRLKEVQRIANALNVPPEEILTKISYK